MKRDLNLCRHILQRLADHSQTVLHRGAPEIDGRREEEVAYHLTLLCEAGLVFSEFTQIQSFCADAELAKGASQYIGWHQNRDSYRLTWAGHEFLEAAQNETLWNNAKNKVMETTGGLAFELLRGLLMQKSKKLLGLE